MKEVARGAQEAARILCSVHGQYTRLQVTDSVGSFEISGCCDEVKQRAKAAVERQLD